MQCRTTCMQAEVHMHCRDFFIVRARHTLPKVLHSCHMPLHKMPSDPERDIRLRAILVYTCRSFVHTHNETHTHRHTPQYTITPFMLTWFVEHTIHNSRVNENLARACLGASYSCFLINHLELARR